MPRFRFIVMTAAILMACRSAPRYDADFSAIDGNHDQIIEWHEFRTYYPAADPKVFLQADHDKNGTVTDDEWQFFITAQGY